MHRYNIADDDYAKIEPLLSGKPGDPGRNADDNRRFINAVLWIARTGAPWQDLPERYGKYNTASSAAAEYPTGSSTISHGCSTDGNAEQAPLAANSRTTAANPIRVHFLIIALLPVS